MSAFKESGAVEYSSDVLFGLQLMGAGKNNFNVDAEKKKDPHQIELKILKNRNGVTGDSLYFDYFPKFNYFRETQNIKTPLIDEISKPTKNSGHR
jgi:replicative DNA helicase